MQSEISTYVLLAGLAIALLWVIVTDLKSRTISNRLTMAVALGAPIFWLSTGLPLWPGVALQIGLAAIVFAVCCILFAIRQMGGGDVKLLSALALWVPPSQFTLLLVALAMLGWVLTMARSPFHYRPHPPFARCHTVGSGHSHCCAIRKRRSGWTTPFSSGRSARLRNDQPYRGHRPDAGTLHHPACRNAWFDPHHPAARSRFMGPLRSRDFARRSVGNGKRPDVPAGRRDSRGLTTRF